MNRWVSHFTSCENRHALPIFTSLLNTVCSYDPTGILPYNHIIFNDSREETVEVALQVLPLKVLIYLLYQAFCLTTLLVARCATYYTSSMRVEAQILEFFPNSQSFSKQILDFSSHRTTFCLALRGNSRLLPSFSGYLLTFWPKISLRF